MHREDASANKVAVEKYVTEFQEYVEAERFVPNKCLIVTRQASSGRKCLKGPT